ncbi:hypothetical protein EXS62_00640, partial [Candidatus Kaiserbacteria bacterium]|nr:hypothetical protein [Candidatus Kaiserbacteria bacterium]
MKKPIIILIEGPMGSGKSTIGALIHKKLKRTALLSTDRVKRFVSDFKRGQRDNKIAAKIIFVMAEQYLKLGISLVVAQAFWKKAYIQPYKALAK